MPDMTLLSVPLTCLGPGTISFVSASFFGIHTYVTVMCYLTSHSWRYTVCLGLCPWDITSWLPLHSSPSTTLSSDQPDSLVYWLCVLSFVLWPSFTAYFSSLKSLSVSLAYRIISCVMSSPSCFMCQSFSSNASPLIGAGCLDMKLGGFCLPWMFFTMKLTSSTWCLNMVILTGDGLLM